MGNDGFTWDAPDEGTWTLDRTHFPKPLCRFSHVDRSRWFTGMGRGFARFGIGVGGRENVIVNGWDYSRRPPLSAEEIERREPIARETLAVRPWRHVAEAWHAVERGPIYEACRTVQAVDPGSLTDTALATHLQEACDLNLAAADIHFEHIALFAAVGEFISACDTWDVPRNDAVALFRGSSPASAAAAGYIGRIADALKATGVKPHTIEDIRAAGEEVGTLLDSYLNEYGWRLVSGFDFCDTSLGEVPAAVVASVVSVMDGGPAAPDGTDNELRSEVESRLRPADRPLFRERLEEARIAYGVRDDDVGASMWARGLVRRALLEIGARLAVTGRLHDPHDVFDATPSELRDLLAAQGGPSADEVQGRVGLRRRQAAADPPPFLGPPPTPPDLSSMPPAVRELTGYFLTYAALMFVSQGEPMRGFGIGTEMYRGRARVVHAAEDALARLEPGDVLVTTMTTPAFNAILPIVGGLVVEEGGLLSHAGITARELGLPAVIGVVNAMRTIADGDTLEVDPVGGTVTVVR